MTRLLNSLKHKYLPSISSKCSKLCLINYVYYSWARTRGGPAFRWVHCQHAQNGGALRAAYFDITCAPYHCYCHSSSVDLFIARTLRHATDRQTRSQSDSTQLKAGNFNIILVYAAVLSYLEQFLSGPQLSQTDRQTDRRTELRQQ